MAHLAEPVVAAGLAERVEQFQAMVVMVASQATAELEATAEPASQARTGRIPEILAQPEGMEATEPLAGPEVLEGSEVRPLDRESQGPTGQVAVEAMGDLLARPETAATAELVML
jgi:hypothetical protein